jgi:hypothetical protein
MAELVDAPGSGSGGRMPVRVRVPLAAIRAFQYDPEKLQWVVHQQTPLHRL